MESGKVDAEHITFVACVGSRQGRMGCSRYCCTSMISQALAPEKDGQEGARAVQGDPHLQPPGRGIV